MRNLLTWCFFLLAVLIINDSLILSTIRYTKEVSKNSVEQFSDINMAGQSSSDEVQDMEEEGFVFLSQPTAQFILFQGITHELVVSLEENPYQDVSLDMICPPPQLTV